MTPEEEEQRRIEEIVFNYLYTSLNFETNWHDECIVKLTSPDGREHRHIGTFSIRGHKEDEY